MTAVFLSEKVKPYSPMKTKEAQDLLDQIYKNTATPEEKELAYLRLSELFLLLLSKE